MKWLSNTYDPKQPDAYAVAAMPRNGQTREEAYQEWKRWLEGKIIADPQAIETYTVEELKRMNMVGVYLND